MQENQGQTDWTNQPRSITTLLESACSSAISSRAKSAAELTAVAAKDKAITVLLTKLALHYWRPDFTPQQARQLYGDYLDDLRAFPLGAIKQAIEKYRQSPEQFYPKSGQLVTLIMTPYAWESRAEHLADLRAAAAKELEVAMAAITAPVRRQITQGRAT